MPKTTKAASVDINSIELLTRLKNLDLLNGLGDWWWGGALGFEVVVGAILTQNTKWEKVKLSLANLKSAGILGDDNASLHNLAKVDSIEHFIAPSGLYRQKSARIIALAQAILEDFGDFASFQQEVSREWLLERKGIGFESADSILNYACGREIMVVDSYSARLLAALGWEMESYEDVQRWFMDMPSRELEKLYPTMPLAQIYARYHGKIVEFSKRKLPIQILMEKQ
ncbi:3-methyladenine DNA glycosylase [Helicobacter canis]|uniref:3-methyladenine DNA glycosylase n=1 Tax=Helicobacter canis TaxID=29419 RepID=A0A5M9QMX9_9HELI|nr:3-methyladenine DNA glycosylase [Helicobacter canis]